MPELKFEEIVKDIRNKTFYPVYFLMGEETFYIDVICDMLEDKVLTETEKEFNFSQLYGKETDIPTMLSVAKRFPMMASHHLVIYKEAQNIKEIEKKEDLLAYIKNPLKSTVLVICYKYKTLDKRKTLFKTISKTGVVFEGKKLYDNQVPGWIDNYVKRKGYRIGPKALQMLADHLGNDLAKIVNEIGKLFISMKKGDEITPKIIEENIGISKDFNIFEFQNALGKNDQLKAYRIAKYFGDNPKSNPLVLTIGLLYQYFAKILTYHSLRDKSQRNVAAELSIHTFFVKDYTEGARRFPPQKAIKAISLLREYDLKQKGVTDIKTDEGELLKEMTYRIMNQK